MSTFLGDNFVESVQCNDPPPKLWVRVISTPLIVVTFPLALMYISLLDAEDCSNVAAAYTALGKKPQDDSMFGWVTYKLMQRKIRHT